MTRQNRPRRSARSGNARRRLLVVLSLLGCVAGASLVYHFYSSPGATTVVAQLAASATEAELDEGAEQRIKAFCGDCHALPQPTSFHRDAWHAEVRLGYEFYAKSGRTDLDPPPIRETVAWYRAQAPEQLTFPQPPDADHELTTKFRVEKLPYDDRLLVVPAVSHLHWLQLQPDREPELVICDMRGGLVQTVPLRGTDRTPRLLAKLHNPCHVEPCDLNADGATDLIVADLGGYPPSDHDRGRVVWLRPVSGDDSYEPVVLASRLGRVADVRPVDVDQDGDLDLIVGVFGLHRQGQVLLLRNVTVPGEDVQFAPEQLDPRPGTIHIPVEDVNQDGHPDFVALISQEYEEVVLFLNQHGAVQTTRPFRAQTLWNGPDLTFGSSGITWVDLDSDQDPDLLLTNGDSFDNSFVNPSHGIQWLENQGHLRFAYHRLADLTGAYCARAGDLDLDGDLDIIAVAWTPLQVRPDNVHPDTLPSIIYLEQTAAGRFDRHTLETGLPTHAVMEMADFDNDGDLDFAVGAQSLNPTRKLPYWVSIWWNQSRS